MAKAQNTFLKSKMNKDLDARILPNGEYRDAVNVQVSKSEGAQVGSLENVLGNTSVLNIQSLTGDTDLQCIGNFADEINSTVYLFLTDYTDTTPDNPNYSPTNNSCIVSYNVLSGDALTLVRGSFLNFSTTNLITGINVLETLLFFTDNRNQPRVIDVTLANPTGLTQPLYYSSEDSISVAKYSPYKAIELWEKSVLAPTSPVPYETTMKDVSSKFLPNGGSGLKTGAYTGATSITLNAGSVTGDIMNPAPSGVYGPTATIGYIPSSGGDIVIIPNATLDPSNPPVYNSSANTWTIQITGGNFPSIPSTETYEIIINPNPYYNSSFSGDPDYLEDKFVRFSYRYRFADNTYSITAPFTQTAFIPKKDGYFMYVDGLDSAGSGPGVQTVDDESEVYRSTVVYFVENKVNSIDLRIPLPYFNYDLQNALKVSEIDILYKESDGLSVKVVETVPISDIASSAGVCLAAGAQTVSAGNPINVDNIQGGINIGDAVIGSGIPDNAFVTSFTPTNPSNPIAGTIEIDQNVVLADNDFITIGDINYFEYNYKSTKPTKTLPESELIRVYDKVPVKALAQEVAGNRVIYGNFINKHNPPNFINYNVACTPKTNFSLNEATVAYTGGAATYSAGTTITVNVNKAPGGFYAGMVITSNTAGVIIPEGTLLTSTTNNSSGAADITLDQNVTFPAGTVVLIFQPGGDILNTTSIIEYPNSSVKTNRNYQVGFVLSDRYGRQSSVILSNNKETITVNGISYSGSTIYSPYIGNIDKDQWPGNSIKLLVNELIDPANAYNGDTTSVNYNPLGWYSYKVVVKQTEQDYYNVYLPGIMAGYPEDNIVELGKTSHTVLINDNINKVPRDLSEVGPDQKQFRSSVQLFGRVQNTNILISSTNTGASNEQYYPGISSDTVTSIATAKDLFEYDATNPSQPNYFPQFYSINSNPLIARISTEKQIGEISTTNFAPASAQVETAVTDNHQVLLTNISGTVAINDLVTGGDLPEGVYVGSGPTGSPPQIDLRRGTSNFNTNLTVNTVLTFTPSANPSVDPTPKHPGIQYLAVYETEPIQSLLDIYWETSTSGLISDLNSLILNNQSTPGAASFSSWNVDTFDEGLAPQSNILAQPFSLVNDFGAAITLDPSNGDYLQLLGVINGNGVSVANSNQDPSFPLALYFELVPASPTGPWQVRTTDINDATMNFYDNIFFMRNEENSFTNRLRNFTFQFKVQIDGQTNYIFQQADLRNVKPLFTKITQGNTTTIPGSPLTPPSIPLSPNFISVESQRDSSVIASIEFQNGAHNPNLAKPTPSWYIGGDVDVVGNEQLFPGMEIIKAKIGSNDDTAEDALLNGEPIFGIDEDAVIGATPPVTYVKLYNFQSDNPYLPALVYYVTVRIQDAGDFQDIVFEIDMSLDVPTDVIKNQSMSAPSWGFPYQGGDYRYIASLAAAGVWSSMSGHPYTLLDLRAATIPGLIADQRGYYAYAAGFFNNSFPHDQQSNNTMTRNSVSLCQYSGIPEDLTYGGPPIVLPWDTVNSQNHKIIKDTDPTVVTFGGTTPIQVYSVCEVTNVETISAISGSGGRTVLTVNLISGNFPVLGMSIANGTSVVPTPYATWLPPPYSGGYENGFQQVESFDVATGKVTMLGRITGGGSSQGTPPIDVQVGDTVYFFSGNAYTYEYENTPWWNNPSGNPVYGSPWYFSQDLNKLKKMLEYSPWGPFCTLPITGSDYPPFDNPYTHDCPTAAPGILSSTYAGIQCEVQNYSNLNFEII